MKRKVVLATVLSCLFLSGCTLETPVGTWVVTYDSEGKSEDIVYVDDEGNRSVIDLENIKANIDKLLEDVELPEGASTEDLKQFIYDSLASLGIDEETLGGLTAEEIEEVEEVIKQSLEEKGVDTSDLDVNLEDVVTN